MGSVPRPLHRLGLVGRLVALLSYATLFSPGGAYGQGVDIFATELFETQAGDERKALAFDDATQGTKKCQTNPALTAA